VTLPELPLARMVTRIIGVLTELTEFTEGDFGTGWQDFKD
jgi:hypothetical protein